MFSLLPVWSKCAARLRRQVVNGLRPLLSGHAAGGGVAHSLSSTTSGHVLIAGGRERAVYRNSFQYDVVLAINATNGRSCEAQLSTVMSVPLRDAAVLQNQHDEWQDGRRHFSQQSMARLVHADGPALLTNPLTEGLVA
jgi:hypothetical protein